jgi:hypothetical protein
MAASGQRLQHATIGTGYLRNGSIPQRLTAKDVTCTYGITPALTYDMMEDKNECTRQ